MTTSDLQKILTNLSMHRPVFHSEADFQHALAWALHEKFPDARIRLEYRVPDIESKIYLDILLETASDRIAIELKYKTRKWQGEHEGESFALRNQSAQDVARYDFIKDVTRLEAIRDTFTKGYAVFLTNSHLYWKSGKRTDTVDAGFRIHEGAILSGIRQWCGNPSEGTTQSRTEVLSLTGTYPIKWHDYSEIAYGFRYILLEVS